MSPPVFSNLSAWPAVWPPAELAVMIFLATFVLEDAALVGAGLLMAAGRLAWPLAFTAGFLGIWLGDLGLYGIARAVGRRFWASFHRFSPRLEQSERWFAQHGALILVSSRIIPGARLPTYLAAGFLRQPFNQFLAVTGLAAGVWTALILCLAQWAGAALLSWLGDFHSDGVAVWLAVPVFLVIMNFLRRRFSPKP